jgi:hypothetical protein
VPVSRFDTTALDDLYARVCATEGVGVADLQAQLADLFGRDRSENDLNDYRLSKQPWKKLADEITPVSRFLRIRKINFGRIRFPLNDEPPDAWFWESSDSEPIGIEVTIAQGTERFHLAKELVDSGFGRGFIGLPDDAPPADFKRAMSGQRIIYTSEHALSAIRNGISLCLIRKNRPDYEGCILLIQAPLRSLPYDRWDAIKPDLRAAAASLPFREVHVVGNADATPWGFQIKG